MPIENPQYDVAISFLSKDEAIANALYEKLNEGLQVFFFPRNQENLEGTDGLESMRTPFFDDSRVMVVLYQEPWGKTPWTRVEETAIKEACLEHGWHRLFFVILDRTNDLPRWLPQNFVRFNYADFGLEQAVGAIKARVQENGGQPAPLTALKRAKILKADQLFRQDKLRMNSEGINAISNKVSELLQQVETRCKEINEQGLVQFRYSKNFQEGNASQPCVMTDGSVGLIISWIQRYINSLDGSLLLIREYNGGLILPEELSTKMYIKKPSILRESKYLPDLSRAREYGWKEENKTDFVSSSALAEKVVITFLELLNRSANGEIQPDPWD